MLIKTPWRPTIQHIVNVHIGGEIFKVRVVEECGCDTLDCHRRRCSFMGSSNEINFEESYLDNLTLRTTDMMVNEGELLDLVASESRTEPCRTTSSPIAGNEDHEIISLTSGKSEHDYPLGKGIIPRTIDRRQKTIDPTARQSRETTSTYPDAVVPKQGESQYVGTTTHAAGEQPRHENGNQEKGEQ